MRQGGFDGLIHKVIRCRSASTTQPSQIWATSVTLNRKSKSLEVEFNTGEKFHFPAEYLRVESPSADAHGKSAKPNTVVHGRRHVGILDVEPVGRYAIRIQFDDLHGSGLFDWDYLHRLGVQKYSRMKAYILQLRRQGQSRDPRKC